MRTPCAIYHSLNSNSINQFWKDRGKVSKLILKCFKGWVGGNKRIIQHCIDSNPTTKKKLQTTIQSTNFLSKLNQLINRLEMEDSMLRIKSSPVNYSKISTQKKASFKSSCSIRLVLVAILMNRRVMKCQVIRSQGM